MSKRRKNKRNKNNVQKASNPSNTNTSSKVGRIPSKGRGTAGIAFYSQLVEKIQPYELKWPQSMLTYEAMKNDDAISSVLNLNYVLLETAFSRYKVKFNKNSPKSVEAAKFLNFCLNNMDQQSFSQFVRNAQTFKEKGFSITEKVYKKVRNGEYEGMWKISQLANRPQMSLDGNQPFETDAGGRRITFAKQNTHYFEDVKNNTRSIHHTQTGSEGFKRIRRKKFILFGENVTDSTPFGNPLFKACYKLWKEKVLLEDLEVNGASKDLAGIIELAIPGEILEKAALDPNSPEALMVDDLLTTAANVHAGTQPYFVRPSDLQESSNSVTDYGIKLLGLEGAGRQFTPGDMITQRRKAIFDIWGAGHTITGEGSKSYNSAEVQNSIHLHYIKRDIQVIEEGINLDLIPQLLNSMNDFDLSHEDMPKVVAGEIDKISIDEVSKMIQRVISVNGLVATKENIIYYHSLLGFDTDSMESMSEKELIESMTKIAGGASRAGEGMGTSGTGSSQNASGGDNNMENKSHFGVRVDNKGVYTTDPDGNRINLNIKDLPKDLQEGFTID